MTHIHYAGQTESYYVRAMWVQKGTELILKNRVIKMSIGINLLSKMQNTMLQKIYMSCKCQINVVTATIVVLSIFAENLHYFSSNYRCAGRKSCINYYNDAVGSTGCFFNFLKVSSALCCSLDIQQLDTYGKDEEATGRSYYSHSR